MQGKRTRGDAPAFVTKLLESREPHWMDSRCPMVVGERSLGPQFSALCAHNAFDETADEENSCGGAPDLRVQPYAPSNAFPSSTTTPSGFYYLCVSWSVTCDVLLAYLERHALENSFDERYYFDLFCGKDFQAGFRNVDRTLQRCCAERGLLLIADADWYENCWIIHEINSAAQNSVPVTLLGPENQTFTFWEQQVERIDIPAADDPAAKYLLRTGGTEVERMLIALKKFVRRVVYSQVLVQLARGKGHGAAELVGDAAGVAVGAETTSSSSSASSNNSAKAEEKARRAEFLTKQAAADAAREQIATLEDCRRCIAEGANVESGLAEEIAAFHGRDDITKACFAARVGDDLAAVHDKLFEMDAFFDLSESLAKGCEAMEEVAQCRGAKAPAAAGLEETQENEDVNGEDHNFGKKEHHAGGDRDETGGSASSSNDTGPSSTEAAAVFEYPDGVNWGAEKRKIIASCRSKGKQELLRTDSREDVTKEISPRSAVDAKKSPRDNAARSLGQKKNSKGTSESVTEQGNKGNKPSRGRGRRRGNNKGKKVRISASTGEPPQRTVRSSSGECVYSDSVDEDGADAAGVALKTPRNRNRDEGAAARQRLKEVSALRKRQREADRIGVGSPLDEDRERNKRHVQATYGRKNAAPLHTDGVARVLHTEMEAQPTLTLGDGQDSMADFFSPVKFERFGNNNDGTLAIDLAAQHSPGMTMLQDVDATAKSTLMTSNPHEQQMMRSSSSSAYSGGSMLNRYLMDNTAVFDSTLRDVDDAPFATGAFSNLYATNDISPLSAAAEAAFGGMGHGGSFPSDSGFTLGPVNERVMRQGKYVSGKKADVADNLLRRFNRSFYMTQESQGFRHSTRFEGFENGDENRGDTPTGGETGGVAGKNMNRIKGAGASSKRKARVLGSSGPHLFYSDSTSAPVFDLDSARAKWTSMKNCSPLDPAQFKFAGMFSPDGTAHTQAASTARQRRTTKTQLDTTIEEVKVDDGTMES
ncbi:unnamed protein product [Amoebophrya sp. A25]|nr:unnamed protein product [Amoebophrya sp. A25]|eukprot:GSA25T00002267001.1